MREMGDGNPSYAFQSYTHPTRKKCLIRPYSGQIQFNKCLLKLYYFRRLSIQNIIGRLPSHKYLDFSRDPQENEKELNWGEKHCLFLAKCRFPSRNMSRYTFKLVVRCTEQYLKTNLVACVQTDQNQPNNGVSQNEAAGTGSLSQGSV